MRLAIYVFILFFSCIACTSHKVSDPSPQSDSIDVALEDSDASDSMTNPPRAADGLFDDFIYSFMRNPRFQRKRIDFPLKQMVDGRECYTKQSEWKHDGLYVKRNIYTILFDSRKSIRAEKDTSLREVTVELINLKKHRMKNYHFSKKQGQWRLIYTKEEGVEKNVNNDFLRFYGRFATNSDFQARHIVNPFEFKTYDYENFKSLEGLLSVEQWPDFRPELPKNVITNIDYGQRYANSMQRVLMICSQSGGMGCSLFFKKKKGEWYLTRLEN